MRSSTNNENEDNVSSDTRKVVHTGMCTLSWLTIILAFAMIGPLPSRATRGQPPHGYFYYCCTAGSFLALCKRDLFVASPSFLQTVVHGLPPVLLQNTIVLSYGDLNTSKTWHRSLPAGNVTHLKSTKKNLQHSQQQCHKY